MVALLLNLETEAHGGLSILLRSVPENLACYVVSRGTFGGGTDSMEMTWKETPGSHHL